MKKFFVGFLTVLLIGNQVFACMPEPGVKTTDIKVRGEVVGQVVNTIPEGSGGSVEVVLIKKAKLLGLELNTQDVNGHINLAITRSNTKKAKINGQFLSGGSTLAVTINEDVINFSVPRTRGSGCGGLIQE